jgi:hypothetical protein
VRGSVLGEEVEGTGDEGKNEVIWGWWMLPA